jgi:hypothetical protein
MVILEIIDVERDINFSLFLSVFMRHTFAPFLPGYNRKKKGEIIVVTLQSHVEKMRKNPL